MLPAVDAPERRLNWGFELDAGAGRSSNPRYRQTVVRDQLQAQVTALPALSFADLHGHHLKALRQRLLTERVRLDPASSGVSGMQERYRSGLGAVALLVGAGAAGRVCERRQPDDCANRGEIPRAGPACVLGAGGAASSSSCWPSAGGSPCWPPSSPSRSRRSRRRRSSREWTPPTTRRGWRCDRPPQHRVRGMLTMAVTLLFGLAPALVALRHSCRRPAGRPHDDCIDG